MYEAWTMAKTWNRRPSEIYCITNEVAAYHLDRAVMLFGLSLEADLDKATKNAKNRKEAERKAALVLDRWLREPSTEDSVDEAQAQARAEGKSGFKDPMERFKKKE